MTADGLEKLSDAALSKAFAFEVANFELGWSGTGQSKEPDGFRWSDHGMWRFCYKYAIPDFANDATSVLPWLEKVENVKVVRLSVGWRVALYRGETTGAYLLQKCFAEGEDPAFARAACIALIRAKRAATVPAR